MSHEQPTLLELISFTTLKMKNKKGHRKSEFVFIEIETGKKKTLQMILRLYISTSLASVASH